VALMEVKDVVMQFGGLRALDHVSLTVEKGTISALIGPNGSGKTTLFNVVTGFLVPNEGKVIYNGERIEGLDAHELASRGISRTFQNIRLLQETTVLENVQLGCHHRLRQNLLDAMFISKRYREEEERSRMDSEEALQFVGLGALRSEKAKNLPYGLQRKLEIARTLVMGAQLLLFDEPCAGMNTMEKEQLSCLILDINRKLNKTIVIIEHDMRFVMKLSEYITVLSQGELLATGSPAEVQNNPKVIKTFLGSARKVVEADA
jgi:branched-chain amino acid transport system ATP-binding protein